MKPSKYTTQCVSQRYREKGKSQKIVDCQVQKFARDALIWGCCVLPPKRSNQSGFYSLSPVPRVNLVREVDIGRHREKCWKSSCSSQVQKNVLRNPVCQCSFFQPTINGFFLVFGSVTKRPWSSSSRRLWFWHFWRPSRFVFYSTRNQFLFSSVKLSHMWCCMKLAVFQKYCW